MTKTDFRGMQRGVIYPTYHCNAKCSPCYFRFKEPFHYPLSYLRAQLNKLRFYYHLRYVDISGGDGTVYPDLIPFLKYCNVIGLQPTLITNGIRITRNMEWYLNDFLISIHGLEDTHNKVLRVKGAYKKVTDNIKKLKINFRTNTIILKDNYKEFPEMAEKFVKLGALVSNFIVFNPFHEWSNQLDISFLPDMKTIGKYLKEAVMILEQNGIKANVRYLPYCLGAGIEENICGFCQVAYDPHEWDWLSGGNYNQNILNQMPEEEFAYKCARGTVVRNSEPNSHCRNCKYEFICDGLQKYYARKQGTDILKEVKGEKIWNPLYFKRENVNIKEIPKFEEGG